MRNGLGGKQSLCLFLKIQREVLVQNLKKQINLNADFFLAFTWLSKLQCTRDKGSRHIFDIFPPQKFKVFLGILRRNNCQRKWLDPQCSGTFSSLSRDKRLERKWTVRDSRDWVRNSATWPKCFSLVPFLKHSVSMKMDWLQFWEMFRKFYLLAPMCFIPKNVIDDNWYI